MATNPGSDDSQLNDLAQRAAAGDAGAQRELVHAVTPQMVSFAQRKGMSLHDAEEVAQEAWIRIIRRLDQYDPSRRFWNWAFVITMHVLIDQWRKSRRQIHPLPFHDDAIGRDEVAALDRIEASTRCLDRLSQEYRQILLTRFRDGYSLKEIAKMTGQTESSIRGKCFRAMSKFLECMRAEGSSWF